MVNKKTKYGLIVLLAIIAVGYATFVYLDNTLKSTIISRSDMQIYQEVSEIENDSDVIATVRVTPNLINHMEYDNDGLPLWYWTEREVIITKPIKGEVKIGDKLTVLEPYAIGENKTIGKLEVISEQYTKMADEEEYIMFLVEREDGKFMIAGKDQGKAMIKPSKEFSTNLEAGSEFEELHKKIRAKYE